MFIGLGFLAILLLVGIAAVIALAIRHSSRSGLRAPSGAVTATRGAAERPAAHTPSGRSTRPVRPPPGDAHLADDLDRWVLAGLLDPTQAAAIAAHERSFHGVTPSRTAWAPPTPPVPVAARRRIPVVAEALGYIGGILGTIGVTLLVQRSWADVGSPAHAALAGVATVLLVVAGALVHERRDPALARLRWTLWLAATATAAVFGWVRADELIDVTSGELEALTIAAVTGALALVLWWNRTRPLQQVVALAAVLVAAGSLTGELADGMATGVVVGLGGALMLAAGIALLTSIPALTTGVGAAGAMVGAFVIASEREGVGLPIACLVAATMLALAITARPVSRDDQRVVLTVFGIITLVQAAPQTIAWFARAAGVAPRLSLRRVHPGPFTISRRPPPPHTTACPPPPPGAATGTVVWLLGLVAVATAVQRKVRGAIALEVIGGLVMLVGAAVTGAQSESVATLAGTATAIGFVGLGTRPGRVLMSVAGSVGLLAFVPWSIAHFFPGEGRAPLLILASGAVLVGVAVLLTRQGGRFRSELTAKDDVDDEVLRPEVGRPGIGRSEAGRVDVDAEEPATEGLVEPR